MRGKVCLITGATSGIGAETAKQLAQCGASVVVVGRSIDRCVHLASSPQIAGVTGKSFVWSKQSISAPATYDEKAQSRLWQVSAEMTGIDPAGI